MPGAAWTRACSTCRRWPPGKGRGGGCRARLHALPGVTITRSGGGVASGYLTASSARAFGRALVRQFRADHARGSYGTDGMFAGESVALAGAEPSPVPRPAFPMHTLTVTATGLAGQ